MKLLTTAFAASLGKALTQLLIRRSGKKQTDETADMWAEWQFGVEYHTKITNRGGWAYGSFAEGQRMTNKLLLTSPGGEPY